jgi:hypothetical protein
MKTLRFFFFVLFYLTVAAGVLTAQDLIGVIRGKVTDENGPVAGAKVSVRLKNSLDYGSSVRVSTNENGNFDVTLREGVYAVKTEFSCMSSRTENVRVLDRQTVVLNVAFVFEDCAKKSAETESAWKACEQETSVAGLQINDSDKAEIVNGILEELFKFEEEFLHHRKEGMFASTENVPFTGIKTFPNQKLTFLNPQKLKAKADRDGDFGYLSFFGWREGSNCAFIGLSTGTAVGKDSKMSYCSQVNGRTYFFRKESGKWTLKKFKNFFE